jgi:hypothetical protein
MAQNNGSGGGNHEKDSKIQILNLIQDKDSKIQGF